MWDQAFSLCSPLKWAVMPACVETIGRCAFENCSRLSEVAIRGSVRCICSNAFLFCRELKSACLPPPVLSVWLWRLRVLSALSR
jgi:hypothetical protein